MKPSSLLMLALVLTGCGGSSPTPLAPAAKVILPANITYPFAAAFSFPDCDSRRELGREVGLSVLSGCHFTGTLQNLGSGCATNVHGITTITSTGSASSWTATTTIVHPNEIFTYSGGPVTVPTSSYQYQTIPSWTNTACN